MPAIQTCAICLREGKAKLIGSICQHDADGLVHRECFLQYILHAGKATCTICKSSLPIKDILHLAKNSFQEMLLQSLLDKDEDTFVKAIEGYLYYERSEVKSLAFVTAASFGFTNAVKHFYQQIFPPQSLFERLMQKFKRPKLPNYYLVFGLHCSVLLAALKIKFGTFQSFDVIGDIRPIALLCAVLDNNAKMLRVLLDLKAGFEVNRRDMEFYPLYHSIANDSIEITKILLEHNGGINPYHIYSAMAYADTHDRKEHKRLLRAYSLRNK